MCESTEKIGAFAGVSGRTVEKIAAVVAAAEAEPDNYGNSPLTWTAQAVLTAL